MANAVWSLGVPESADPPEVVIPTPTISGSPVLSTVWYPAVSTPALVLSQPKHWVWFAGGWQRIR